jgi:ferritin-like metal-binding protein YciE
MAQPLRNGLSQIRGAHMSLRSLKDLYLDELGVLYDAEGQMLRAIPRFIERVRAPALRHALDAHRLESRLHLDRLELIFTHWGERLAPRVCKGVMAIVQETDDRLDEPATHDARDAMIAGAVQRLEHYEIAAYGAARGYAMRLNRADEARLLQETLDEESRADRLLVDVLDAQIHTPATAVPDFAERKSRVAFAASGQVDHSR